MAEPATPPERRFWPKVTQHGECWEWTGARARNGYGVFGVRRGRIVLAHRWSYRAMVGEIPRGLDLDHLCRNRACVNPWHLEPVTRSVNVRRGDSPRLSAERWGAGKTHCQRGHPFDDANTYVTPDGRRKCRECNRIGDRERQRIYRAKRKALVNG